VPKRDRKAVLVPVNDLVRQNPPHRALEDIFRGAPPQLQLRGNGRGELDELVIKQRQRASKECAMLILSTLVRISSGSEHATSRYCRVDSQCWSHSPSPRRRQRKRR
jgi:hypothetical protein